MKPPHVAVTASAVLGAFASMAVALTALSAPLHTLFGMRADNIVAAAAIVSALLAGVAGIGKSPLSPPSGDANASTIPIPPAQAGRSPL